MALPPGLWRGGHVIFKDIVKDTILKQLENNGSYVDALFADVVKAFDRLDHNVVVEEAKAMGACPFVV